MSRPHVPLPMSWEEARRTLLQHLQRHAAGRDPDHLEDLAQEACVRLLRAVRREAPRDLNGLMASLAHRTWVDHVRRWRRTRDRFGSPAAMPGSMADPGSAGVAREAENDPDLGHLLDRLELVVQEAFLDAGAEACAGLARAFFAERDWRQVADDLGVGHATVRKRWSRCLTLVRDVLRRDPQYADLFPRRSDAP